jgi:hypothetical protein
MKNPRKLKIKTLSGKWCDKDLVLLHASFQILTDFIKKEKPFTTHVDWSHDEKSHATKKEIEELYAWWMKRVKLDSADHINDLDGLQYYKDNEMLIRLIQIRQYLWT